MFNLFDYASRAQKTAFYKEHGFPAIERIQTYAQGYTHDPMRNPLKEIGAVVYTQILKDVLDFVPVNTFGLSEKMWLRIWKLSWTLPLLPGIRQIRLFMWKRGVLKVKRES